MRGHIPESNIAACLQVVVLEGRSSHMIAHIPESDITACAQVVDMKGEPFLSGLAPWLPDLSKKFAQLGMQVTSLLSPR